MASEPLSIEALLEKQKAEKEAASKPKFLSKEERAALAIARRAKEIQEEKQKNEQMKREHEMLERDAKQIEMKNRYGRESETRYGHPEKDRRRERDRRRDHRDKDRERTGDRDRNRDPQRDHDIPTGPKADRERNGPGSSSSPMPPPPVPFKSGSEEADYTPPLSSTDLSAIRSRYLGVDSSRKKRKIRKMNDRKFVFDWDAGDDTYDDTNTFAVPEQSTVQGQGPRRHIGGMDLSVVAKDSNPQLADPMERRKAAKSGLDERHWSEKPLSEMKDRDWRIFREDYSISARGGQIPHPLRSWKESSIPQTILDVIERIGYKEPSPIQRQAIPIGLQNRDVIGIAETGSGKTAAFVIPMLAFISGLPPFSEENRHLGPYALILAPTRELAQQIESEAKKFAMGLGFNCVSIVGGRAVEEQQFNLREGAEIIIATPGRLKDVIERHVIVLSQCRYIVMDEADRMVNLGFEADLTFILDQLPSDVMGGEDSGMVEVQVGEADAMDVDGNFQEPQTKMVAKGRTRVTTLFSATMPPAVERLARKYLKRPAIITIGEAGRAVDTVDQRVDFVSGDEKKKNRLLEILNSGLYHSPIIVFVNQKKMADMVAKDLSKSGWSTSTLHSGKSQEQREAALQALRTGEADVLVATDLAGRGIDVQDVSLVVNFQMANTIEAYIHRIGRTGRAGKMGIAITFLSNEDDEVMYDLKNEISKSPVSKVSPELARHESAQHRVTRDMKRKRDENDIG